MMKFFFIIILIVNVFVSKAQQLQPNEKEVLVEVFVKDVDSKPLSGETVIFFGRRTQNTYQVKTDLQGSSSILLPKKDVYEVSYKDLLKEKEYALLEVPEEPGLFTFTVEIEYEPSRVFVLENVYFDFAKSTLTTQSYPALNELVQLLKAEPNMHIEIAGHTDNVGSSEANLRLSQQRAESVRSYLISKGIDGKRVIARGYGDTMPIASNETDQGRQMNRRTEVKILSKP
jgi:OmpA-OmpF porin, OOP family